jgi:CheY-like chemotaxis protein
MKNLKLMLIDDDSDDRDFFKLSLINLDIFTFCEAENGQDAIEKLLDTEYLPDYIFLDINMPVMDGFDTLEELKTIDKLKDIPVIMLSTSSVEKDKLRSLELGALCYVEKPTNVNRIKELVTTAIEDVDNIIQHEP